MLDLTTLAQDPYHTRPVNSLGAIAARDLGTSHVGRTAGGQFTRSWLPSLEGDDFPPDSKFWAGQAKASLNYLVDLLGRDQYRAWFDLVWPPPTADRLTWRTLRDMAEASITAADAGERDIHTLAEAAHQRLEQLLKENL